MVSGVVTFDGGACPAAGNVTFQPVSSAGSGDARPGTGAFETDGAFTIETIPEGAGLLPGTYLAKVTCDGDPPATDIPGAWADISLIDPSYEPETITVEEGSGSMTVNLDVPAKKE